MITGCAGFIGSHMVDLILETSDDNVVGVDCFTYAGKKENLCNFYTNLYTDLYMDE